MGHIAFLAPNEAMCAMARATLGERYPDVCVERGLLSAGVRVARTLAEQGVEIIIARGGTATLVRQADLGVTVVDVPITGFDVIRAVEQAKKYGRHIAVVAFASMVMGIECLGAILDVELRMEILNDEFEAPAKVRQAFAAGADVVLGGVITSQAAEQLHRPYVLLATGPEGILQAVQEAKRIAHARRLEKVKTELFKTVLDYAYEGIVSVDGQGKITIFNPVAAHLTGIDGNQAVGKDIDQVWPQLRLRQVVSGGREDLGHLLKVRGTRLLCNKVPICVGGQVAGAVATVQDVSRIQQMEARIRREIYARGHVADHTFADVLGDSPAIREAVATAQEFAATPYAVLIQGETGTGKEVFAQSIHNYSPRAAGPFVAVNCAALPGQILESELFGYVGGAFTGANREGKPGLFEVAHGGAIFLDEIAEMDQAMQGKLLRVLQEKQVVRVGSDKVIPVDVRVIAATNKNLSALVGQNKFRADLYYRLNVLCLRLPPLRDRRQDIKVLAGYFLQRAAASLRRELAFTPAALEALTRHDWPGNVRELQNVIQRLAVLCRGPRIEAALVERVLADDQERVGVVLWHDQEAEEIKKALAEARGKYTKAAQILGVSRSTLWRRMRRLGLR